MKNSIGSEKRVCWCAKQVPALPCAAADSANGSPPSSTWRFEAMTIFWLGQITSQTLRNMSIPKNHAE